MPVNKLVLALLSIALAVAAGCGSAPSATRSPAPSVSPSPSVAVAPSPTVQPTVTSSPASTPVALPIEGPLVGGTTYVIDDPAVSPVRMIVTVPDGWRTFSRFLYKASGSTLDETTAMLSHWKVSNVYRDPCHWSDSLPNPPIGPTVDDLANALAAQIGRSASAPIDVTIDGYSGKQVDLSLPADFDRTACDEGEIKTWSSGPSSGDYGGFVYGPGQRDSIYVIDVDGERVVIHRLYLPGTPDATRAELQSIFESIRLAPNSP